MIEFLRSLALACAPVVASRLLDVAIEAHRAQPEPEPDSFAAFVRSRA